MPRPAVTVPLAVALLLAAPRGADGQGASRGSDARVASRTAEAQSAPQASAERPAQVALFAPIQAFHDSISVRGFRFSFLYGRNADVHGVDIGLGNHVTGDFGGFQFGGVGVVEGDMTGFQASLLTNFTSGHMQGLQFVSAFNRAATGRGAQVGALNHSRNYRGLQLGIVNYAASLHGVQVGIVNIIRRGGAFPVLPIVNWSFSRNEPD